MHHKNLPNDMRRGLSMTTNRLMIELSPKHYPSHFTDDTAKINDIKAIAAFLMDDKLVKEQLAKLEHALELAAGERFDPVNRRLHGFTRGQPFKHNKLLSGYFEKWLAENGFPPLVRLRAGLTDKEFNDVLSSGQLFKDNVFRGTIHGEWSHIIQLICAFEYHKQKPFLSCEPIELYRWLGDVQNNHKQKDLWFRVFEINNINYPKVNITSIGATVANFQAYLVSEEAEKEFPVLSQLIQGRENKGTKSKPSEKRKRIAETDKKIAEIIPTKENYLELISRDNKTIFDILNDKVNLWKSSDKFSIKSLLDYKLDNPIYSQSFFGNTEPILSLKELHFKLLDDQKNKTFSRKR